MHVLIVNDTSIPVTKYGGTERVIWGLGKELVKLGHKVTYLVGRHSSCPFAKVLTFDPENSIAKQVPEGVDIVHMHLEPHGISELTVPYIITIHGNTAYGSIMKPNTVFVSENHASRFQSDQFVHNGLSWEDYSKPDLSQKRKGFHFLGKAKWKVKNMHGACEVIKKTADTNLQILGGNRWNIKNGWLNVIHPRIYFKGMVGGSEKDTYINNSKGLLFPVRWHEPFGLAVIESLYFGAPVFATPYGSLPELITPETGFLSNVASEWLEAIHDTEQFASRDCHEIARELYSSLAMTKNYLKKYEQVLNGNPLSLHEPIVPKEEVGLLPWIT